MAAAQRLWAAELLHFHMLMHSEAIADQRQCLRRFAALGDGFAFGFARSHYSVVACFGRFPHRNPLLGRRSTDAEKQAVAKGSRW